MNLRDLVYVVAVADHQSFTRAAEIVHVSQPALSNQIKKLEAELGIDIFERRRGEICLTEFGTELVEMARQINGLVDQIGDMAQRHKGVEANPFRLGMTPTLAAYLSRYFRDMFTELFPKMRLIIVEDYPAQLAQMVESYDVDLALIAKKSHEALYSAGGKRALEFTSLWYEPLFLAVRKGHAMVQHGAVWAHEVPRDLFIRFNISFGYDLEKDLPEPSGDAAEKVGIDVRSARFETVCRYVAQSDSCTIVNAIAATQFKQDGFGLHFLPFKDEGNLRDLGAVNRPNFPRRRVLDEMHRYIQTNPPAGTVASQVTTKAALTALGLNG